MQAGTLPHAVEYYHAGLDHYFVTAESAEVAKLDAGAFVGWQRTGHTFAVLAATAAAPRVSPVCRFYGNPAYGLDSHFYSASPAECDAVRSKWPEQWLFEGANVFKVFAADAATGACPAGSKPVFRLYNNRRDGNHRYTTDAGVATTMLNKGYVMEGFGIPAIGFCAPGPDTLTVPTCTLTAGTLTPTVQQPLSLQAVCTGAPSSYAWNNCQGTGALCTAQQSTAGTVGYSVVATNGAGASAPAALTVTWKPGPEASGVPVCTLAAATATPQVGANLVLTATCAGTPTAFVWQGCTSTGNTCTAQAAAAGAVNYAVAGVNASGTGQAVGVTVTWQAAPTPVCTLVASNAQPATGTTVMLTATCSNNPTQFDWLGCVATGNTCVATAAAPGSVTYGVTARNGSGAGPTAAATVAWQAPAALTAPACTMTPSSNSPGTSSILDLAASCTNNPTEYTWTGCSSGTTACATTQAAPGWSTYTVTAANAGGRSAPAVASVYWKPGPPVCTLTTSSVQPDIGTPITLVAECSGGPTAYAWTNCSSATNTCVATSQLSGPTVYSVVASNAGGMSAPATRTVAWRAPVAAVPVCTVASNNATPMAGTSVTLTATCSNAPQSYAWTGCVSLGATCTATQATAGSATYGVSATNAAGVSAPATVTTVWQAPPPGSPVCTLTSSSSSPLVGNSVTLTANCTGAPTGYAWTNCASTTNTCVTNSAVPEPVTYAVVASNAGGASPAASTTVAWHLPAPTCTLETSNAKPQVRTSITLTAVCSNNPDPAGYAWSGCASTGATCTLAETTPGFRLYQVAARNSGGTSAVAKVGVTWEELIPTPVCTVTASSLTPTQGTSILLTATCSGTPSSYAWTHCSGLGPTCAVRNLTAETVTYGVTASNGGGAGAPATVAVAWQPTAVPVCTLTAPTTTPVPGTAVTLTATCTGDPGQYKWSNCTSTTAQCTVSSSVAAVRTVSMTATNAAGTSQPVALGISWQAAAKPPVCTILVKDTEVTTEDQVVMQARCTEQPTSYTWTGCTMSHEDGCMVRRATAGTATYTVVANNAAGASLPAAVTLNWTYVPPRPVCTLAPDRSPALLGETVTLTAYCSNNPTTYSWTNCNSTGPTCTDSSAVVGSKAYAVTAANDTGSSMAATTSATWTWAPTPGPRPFVSASATTTFVRKPNGDAVATGYGSTGVLGTGSLFETLNFVPSLTEVTQMSAGLGYGLAIREDQTAWLTGAGQVITPVTNTGSPLWSTTGIADVRAIAAGMEHALIVTADGTLFALGRNDSGQLGVGDTNPRPMVTPVLTNVAQAVTGGAAAIGFPESNLHQWSAAVKHDGTVWTTGYNRHGQLALPSTGTWLTWTQVSDFTNVKALAASDMFLLALKHDGTLWAAGFNNREQWGTPSPGQTGYFIKIADQVASMGVGPATTHIIKFDGTLWMAGSNGYGQMGFGDRDSRSGWQLMFDGEWVQAAAQGFHNAFVLKHDGTLWAAGNNESGQLGLGDRTTRTHWTYLNP